MMDVSRRSFLGGALALTAARSIPFSGLGHVPLIWGDGVHDDWAGLQAALNGEPFRAVGNRVIAQNVGGKVLIHHGSFRLSRTLVVPESGAIWGGAFYSDDDNSGPVIHLRGGLMSGFSVAGGANNECLVLAEPNSCLINGCVGRGRARFRRSA